MGYTIVSWQSLFAMKESVETFRSISEISGNFRIYQKYVELSETCWKHVEIARII